MPQIMLCQETGQANRHLQSAAVKWEDNTKPAKKPEKNRSPAEKMQALLKGAPMQALLIKTI